ncbi:hypothetical protein, partial [Aromatoleum toluvorans]|uniref:hypothetical protein n=1 Tax=Aromatoleum toluvorans TaxID=92002 RepID=UPI001B7D05FF
VLAVGGGVIVLGGAMMRSSPEFDRGGEVLAGASATEARSEPRAFAEAAQLQAATIVEVPASTMEARKFAVSGYDRGDAGGGKARPADARPEKVHAARGHEPSVRVPGAKREAKRRGGAREGAVKSAPVPTRRLPANAKHMETSVDADVQVIEAIVARPQ